MKPRRTLDEMYALQIGMACFAGVSGTLSEWPMLRAALKDRGIDLPPETLGHVVREACWKLYNAGGISKRRYLRHRRGTFI